MTIHPSVPPRTVIITGETGTGKEVNAISSLWPPAAAMIRARLACHWPATSASAGSGGRAARAHSRRHRRAGRGLGQPDCGFARRVPYPVRSRSQDHPCAQDREKYPRAS